MPEKEAPKPQEQKPKPKLPLKTIIVILGVLLLEGGTVSIFMVMRGGPQQAGATDPIEGVATEPKIQRVEVAIAEDFSVDNYVSGRTRTVITLGISAKVDKSHADLFKTYVTENQAEILDCIRNLISSASPDHLRDPLKQVVKRDLKAAIEQIVGEGYINEILLPSWQSYEAD
jgi:flagellar basal body-associated protein FliL